MNLLDKATDWTNQTNEERAEMCAIFLHTFNLMTAGEQYRTRHRIRVCADSQRECRARVKP
ncbi:hypothetical protein EDF57_103566 [Novosphingobium sp. PhB55]|uniref:hypothetical protein n=1 Tax=Novosphingobium sp. PhB55 TaxID=2485106 RepID=UPI00106491CC|nr:hypothetical protein [Novosphingobium sp. PhB55]TDW65382.1 hypothetical protein EDF57_103566 [Novosphingobium sp. PhB55]